MNLKVHLTNVTIITRVCLCRSQKDLESIFDGAGDGFYMR